MLLIAKFDTIGIEDKIEQVEAEYRFRFPEQYRKFILKYNGGRSPSTVFKVKPRRKEKVLAFFGYGIKERQYDLNNFPVLVDDWVETGFIPIAIESGDCDYLIGIKQQNYGKIYIADYHEQALELVRNSFNEFILSCYSGKIDPLCYMSVEEREARQTAKGYGHLITDELKAMWQREYELYNNMVLEEVVLD